MRPATLLCAALFAIAPMGLKADERQTYDGFIDYAARICPGHSKDRTTPGIRNVRIESLWVMAKLGYFLCPDRRVESPMAVIFYADRGVFTWNPDSPASVNALRDVTGMLSRSEDYPNSLTVWDADGKELTNQVVPAFTPREAPIPHRLELLVR